MPPVRRSADAVSKEVAPLGADAVRVIVT